MARRLENRIYQSELTELLSQDIPWEKLDHKTICITGATGMIASVIVDLLMCRNREYGSGIRIIAVSRSEAAARESFDRYWGDSNFRWLPHDITKPFPEAGCMDYMLHAASNTHPRAYATDPVGTITANVQGTYELLTYAASHSCRRFFFFSSVEIYGENRGDTDQFNEAYLGYLDCNTLRAGYPESKRLGEALCNAFAAKYGQDFVIGRFSRVYGPTMAKDDSKAIAQFIRKAVFGEDIVLKSQGNQLYSYTYAADAALAALVLLLRGESGSAVNIVDRASDIRLKDLAALLAKEAGTKVVFELPDEVERAGYSAAQTAVLDDTKIVRLGWKPLTPIRQGLSKTVSMLRQFSAMDQQ